MFIDMDEAQAYDLLMEWADEIGARPYIIHKLNRMAEGVKSLGTKSAAVILLCAIAKGVWPQKEGLK